MKRYIWVIAIGAAVALATIVCVGLTAGILYSPVKARISRLLIPILARAENLQQVEPRVEIFETRPGMFQAEEGPGVLVAGVVTSSPAEQAGLQRGDILLSVDGKEVNQFGELQAVLQTYQPGDSVELAVQRGDREITLTATLAEPSGAQSRRADTAVFLGILPCGGCELQTMPEEMFSIPMERGAQILEVISGSPAERAGLKAGMLISAVGGQPLNRMSDLATMLAEYKPGDRVELTVQPEDGEEQEIAVTLGDNPDNPGAAWLGIRYGMAGRFEQQWQMPEMPEGGQGLPELPPGWSDMLPEGPLPFAEMLQPGALIREVKPGSPAEKAGLIAGQVIQAVDGEAIEDQQALPDALAAHAPGDSITLTIFDPSEASEQTREVEVTLGENPDKAGAAWLGIGYIYLDLKRLNPENLPEG